MVQLTTPSDIGVQLYQIASSNKRSGPGSEDSCEIYLQGQAFSCQGIPLDSDSSIVGQGVPVFGLVYYVPGADMMDDAGVSSGQVGFQGSVMTG